MSDQVTFNLLDQPWVKVRALSGIVEELSLPQVFEQAPHLRGLAGEIPTQDAAMLRLLEAVLLGAVRPPRPRNETACLDLWEAWWNAGTFPDLVDEYLERHRERFDLLDSIAPFLQVSGLHTASGNASGLVKLIADVPDGHQYFTTRAGKGLDSLTFAEAARWLVHCHAFDCAGIKTGAAGDGRVKGGKGYSMGYPAWAGNLGLIIVEGGTLFETLMLNLPLPTNRPEDVPVWERPPLGPAVDVSHPAPVGPADVFTWPSRRILLHAEHGQVVDVQISNGDRLGPQNQQVNEPMSSWRKSQNQSKGGTDVFMPVGHSPERRIWQGLGPLLLRVEGVSLRAPALEWLDTLRLKEVLPRQQRVSLKAVGVEYGAQASSIVGVVADELQVQVAAITDLQLAQVAVDAAGRASAAVIALANLASNLELASGGDAERPRERTFEWGYSLLDRPYQMWLARLGDTESAPQRLDDWGQIAARIILDTGSSLIASAGPEAVVGRDVPKRGSDELQHLDAALAEIWFRGAVSKALMTKAAPAQQEVE